MSSVREGMDSGSSGPSGRKDKNTENKRRSWTPNEEVVLIAALKQLITSGWKSDNGFRSGYLIKLEHEMKKAYPTTDLQGTPHINSRLTSWKKYYNSLLGILSRSGVGFNARGDHTIDCEDDQWEQILKMDSNARGMRYKSWPYFDDWKEIFGNDRANGESAEDMVDVANELLKEDNLAPNVPEPEHAVNLDDFSDDEDAGDRISQTKQEFTAAPTHRAKKRKEHQELSGVCEILGEFGRRTDARLKTLVERIGAEFDKGKARKKAFEELGKIPGLSLDERFDACELLAAKQERVEIFMSQAFDARAYYVNRLLKNKAL